MDDILSLDVESMFPENARDDIFKLGDYIKESENLQHMFDGWYLSEAVVDPRAEFKKTFRTKSKNAGANAALGMKVANSMIDAKAAEYSLYWKGAMKGMGLIVNIWNLIVKILGWLPRFIMKILVKIQDASKRLINKISGNIELYITIEDLSIIYTKGYLGLVDNFITSAGALAKGNCWGDFKAGLIGQVLSRVVLHRAPTDKEKKVADNMIRIANQVKDVSFEKTIIKMRDRNTVAKYFGGGDGVSIDKVTHVKDIDNMSYIEAINFLMLEIQRRQDQLREVADMVVDKEVRTRRNPKALAEMDRTKANLISRAIHSIEIMMTFVAKLLKYIAADMQTYNNVLLKLQEAERKAAEHFKDAPYST